MFLESKLCNEIFEESIRSYHIHNNIDSPLVTNYQPGDIRFLLFRKNWIDTIQWHLEDEIRNPSIASADALIIKRKIDKSNQDRTDIVESLDQILLGEIGEGRPNAGAQVNTETPAWAIDRLSILGLKIFHMREAANREDSSQQHRNECNNKLNVLLIQKVDLSESIDQLLSDIRAGKKILKLYKQMKMYNDPELNPVLYKL